MVRREAIRAAATIVTQEATSLPPVACGHDDTGGTERQCRPRPAPLSGMLEPGATLDCLGGGDARVSRPLARQPSAAQRADPTCSLLSGHGPGDDDPLPRLRDRPLAPSHGAGPRRPDPLLALPAADTDCA